MLFTKSCRIYFGTPLKSREFAGILLAFGVLKQVNHDMFILNVGRPVTLSLSKGARRGLCPHASTELSMTSFVLKCEGLSS